MSNRPNTKSAARRRPAPRPGASRAQHTPVWRSPAVIVGAGVTVVVVVAIILAVTLTGGDDDGESVASEGGAAAATNVNIIEIANTEDLVVEDASLPQFVAVNDDAAIGRTAPSFTTVTFAGEARRLGTDDGTARLIGFFAHWCPHCQREVPNVTAYLAENPLPAGIEVAAVSTAVGPDQGNYPPSAWFDREGWPTEVLLDDEFGRIADAYGLRGFPFWVVVDGNGEVLVRVSGELSTEQFAGLVAIAEASVATGGS